ncbi:MAG: histidinol-phosphate transaminase [Patescibacteria group bacterium]
MLFRKAILKMRKYAPPIEGRTGKNYLRLDFNERTKPPHPLVRKMVKDYVRKGDFQIYPEYGDLNKILANFFKVSEYEVMATNGADQAIDVVLRSLIGEEDSVIIPKPTFPIFEQSARIQGAKIISPRYQGKNLTFPFKEIMKIIKRRVKLLIICNPNNPTGTIVLKSQCRKLIEKAKEAGIAVVIDETYHSFSPGLTVLDLIKNFDNLFVIRSFAKNMGIPGLRAGCVISQKKNIEELVKIRGPYDVSMPAVFAIKSLKYLSVRKDIEAYVAEVMKVSKPMIEKFYIKNKIKFFPSGANFHLIKDEDGRITAFLKSKNIIVRKRSDPKGTVRVSIGTREDTRKYLEALSEYLKTQKA